MHLRIVLASVFQQSVVPASICLADDGSSDDTLAVIKDFQELHPQINMRHRWHADNGFAKNQILNQAIETSEATHLVFIDDDCVMHPNFIARHRALAAPKRYMAGSVIRVSAGQTQKILDDGEPYWDDGLLRHWSAKSFSKKLKSNTVLPVLMPLLDCLSPVKKNWAGGNASAYRQALLDVNGFDETLQYGGEDKELGARLENNGVRGRHLRYTAPLYHLDHGRGYVDEEAISTNRAAIQETRKSGRHWTKNGIIK